MNEVEVEYAGDREESDIKPPADYDSEFCGVIRCVSDKESIMRYLAFLKQQHISRIQ